MTKRWGTEKQDAVEHVSVRHLFIGAHGEDGGAFHRSIPFNDYFIAFRIFAGHLRVCGVCARREH